MMRYLLPGDSALSDLWPDSVEPSLNLELLLRCYDRCADPIRFVVFDSGAACALVPSYEEEDSQAQDFALGMVATAWVPLFLEDLQELARREYILSSWIDCPQPATWFMSVPGACFALPVTPEEYLARLEPRHRRQLLYLDRKMSAQYDLRFDRPDRATWTRLSEYYVAYMVSHLWQDHPQRQCEAMTGLWRAMLECAYDWKPAIWLTAYYHNQNRVAAVNFTFRTPQAARDCACVRDGPLKDIGVWLSFRNILEAIRLHLPAYDFSGTFEMTPYKRQLCPRDEFLGCAYAMASVHEDSNDLIKPYFLKGALIA
jgi:hypothetical protein